MMENNNVDLKNLVKDNNMAKISHCIAGVIYYTVECDGHKYMFVVDMNNVSDVGTATFEVEMKAITLMRYIRLSMKDNSFIKLS